MIGESWANGCLDQQISVGWILCRPFVDPTDVGGGGGAGGKRPAQKVILPATTFDPAAGTIDRLTDAELALLAVQAIMMTYYR